MSAEKYVMLGIGSLSSKLFWPTVEKNCSSDREKLLKFVAEPDLKNLWDHYLEQFIQTVKGQDNSGNRMPF